MSKSRGSQGDGALFALLVVLALLWWLRYVILAAAAVAALVFVIRWLIQAYAAHRAAEQDRHDALRLRAEVQNAQVLRGDPHGFYGQYPLPDPELIPRWYRAG